MASIILVPWTPKDFKEWMIVNCRQRLSKMNPDKSKLPLAFPAMAIVSANATVAYNNLLRKQTVPSVQEVEDGKPPHSV